MLIPNLSNAYLDIYVVYRLLLLLCRLVQDVVHTQYLRLLYRVLIPAEWILNICAVYHLLLPSKYSLLCSLDFAPTGGGRKPRMQRSSFATWREFGCCHVRGAMNIYRHMFCLALVSTEDHA